MKNKTISLIKKLFHLAAGIMLVAAVAYIALELPKRINSEKQNKDVEICISWNELYDLCYSNDYKLSDFLERAKAIGVSSIALKEESLSSLAAAGKITFYPNSDYKQLKMLDMFSPITKVKSNAIIVSNKLLAAELTRQFKSRYDITIKTRRSGRYRIIYPTFFSSFRPSFWSEQMPMGFSPNKVKYIKERGFKIVLRPRNVGNPKWMFESVPDNISGFLWGDTEVPGYPGKEKELAEYLNLSSIKFIDMEFVTLYGEKRLGRLAYKELVRGHVIPVRELNKAQRINSHLPRWIRAVKERGNRFLFIHFWKQKSIEDNISYLRAVAKAVKKNGFMLAPSAVPKYPSRQNSRLWLILLSAIIAPVLGIFYAVKFKNFILAYLASNFFVVTGGLFISVLLYNILFMQKVALLPGVKAVMFLPLILSLFIVYPSKRLKKIWFSKVHIAHVAGALTLLSICGLMLLRSGNYSMGMLSPEKMMRHLLENLLSVRPRTKEFLFGQPLLLLGFYLKRRYIICLGLIGQVSIINTFLHAHSPVMISLMRTLHGIWLGMFIGFTLIGVFEIIKVLRSQKSN